jgi:hypothetical protein
MSAFSKRVALLALNYWSDCVVLKFPNALDYLEASCDELQPGVYWRLDNGDCGRP